MAVIDYATCGINDVIEHSLKLHPQLLADRLRSHARAHAEFADAYGDRQVTRNELALADRLHGLADAIELGDTTMPRDDDVRREAFGCAAWLQDLHPIMQVEVVEREDARNAFRESGRGRCSPNDSLNGTWQPPTQRFRRGFSPG
jgi:hypothetical protein